MSVHQFINWSRGIAAKVASVAIRFIEWLVGIGILSTVVAVLTWGITNWLGSPRPFVRCTYAINVLSGNRLSPNDPISELLPKYKPDNERSSPGFSVNVENSGWVPQKNLRAVFRCKSTEILAITASSFPSILIRNSRNQTTKHEALLTLDQFPVDASVSVSIKTNRPVTSTDVGIEVLTDDKVWKTVEQGIDIGDLRQNLIKRILGRLDSLIANAKAEDIQNHERRSEKGEVLIGGYDVMAILIDSVNRLRANQLISDEQVNELKAKAQFKEGVLIKGVNVLKTQEALINQLISNGVLSKADALAIINKSKNAGGVTFGGYNPVVLQAGIMQSLVQNKKVGFNDAKAIFENAYVVPRSN